MHLQKFCFVICTEYDNTVKSSFEITVVAPTVEFTSATNEITLGDAVSLNVNATNIENKKVYIGKTIVTSAER